MCRFFFQCVSILVPPVKWMMWRVERAVGMMPEGGRRNGRFMDRDRRGARSPKPCQSFDFFPLAWFF